MRHWRIVVWLLLALAAVVLTVFDAIPQPQRSYAIVAVIVIAAVFFLATLITDKVQGRDVDKEMAEVERILRHDHMEK